MTDRELLELAGKAAGQERSVAGDLWSNARGDLWNPLNDDGDALQLSLNLVLKGAIKIQMDKEYVTVFYCHDGIFVPCTWTFAEYSSPAEAFRRCVVRGAVEYALLML